MGDKLEFMEIDRLLNRLEHAIISIFCRRSKKLLDRHMDGVRKFVIFAHGEKRAVAEFKLCRRWWQEGESTYEVDIFLRIVVDPCILVQGTDVLIAGDLVAPALMMIRVEDGRLINFIRVPKPLGIANFSLSDVISPQLRSSLFDGLVFPRKKWIRMCRRLVDFMKKTRLAVHK